LLASRAGEADPRDQPDPNGPQDLS
jgi:hypothetical protein